MKTIKLISIIIPTYKTLFVILSCLLICSIALFAQTSSAGKTKTSDSAQKEVSKFIKGRYFMITPQPTDSNKAGANFDISKLSLARPSEGLSVTRYFEGQNVGQRKIVLRPGLLLSNIGSNFAAALSFPKGVLELKNVGGNAIKLRGGGLASSFVLISCNVQKGKQYMATLDLENASSSLGLASIFGSVSLSSRSYVLVYRQGDEPYKIVQQINGRGQLSFLINMPATLDHDVVYTEFFLYSPDSGTYTLHSFTVQEL